MHDDLTLPLRDGKKHAFLPNSTTVMAPSWVAQYDDYWAKDGIPAEHFYAERFLKHDPETGKDTLSLAGASGRLFPFGAGHDICPGRVFAKQMMITAIATILLDFEITPIGFIDGHGTECDDFVHIGKEYAGAGVVKQDGDLKVKLRRRTPKSAGNG